MPFGKKKKDGKKKKKGGDDDDDDVQFTNPMTQPVSSSFRSSYTPEC